MSCNFSLLVAALVFMAMISFENVASANQPVLSSDYAGSVSGVERLTSVDHHEVMHYDYDNEMYYDVYVAPGMATDIQLEPGERVVQPLYLQNPMHWDIDVKTVEQDGVSCQHVYVTSSECGVRSLMEIITNKRSYIIDLNCYADSYMQAVKWNYLKEVPHQGYAGNRND